MKILGRNRLPQSLMADFNHTKLSDVCLNFKLRCIYQPNCNNSFLHFMKEKTRTNRSKGILVDTSVIIITISKNCTASLERIEVVITINKNRRGSHIV